MPPPSTSSSWSAFDPRTRWGQICLALLLLRCYSAFFGYGYIHPDEWMQSGEAYFGFTLPGIDARIPWEWRPDKALRSISSLHFQYTAVDALLPLLKKILGGPLTGRGLFVIQRAASLLWTLLIDLTVASDFPSEVARYILCLFGISTAATTFLVRPFSNSQEANTVATCLMFCLALYRNRAWYKRGGPGWCWPLLVPSLLAADGLFTRFTFAFFVLPIALVILHRFLRIVAEGYPRPALISVTVGALAAGARLYNLAERDTTFYTHAAKISGIEAATLWGTQWVVPPVNALLYNIRTENVAQHGLHPRWLHAVVNLPMMVGVANCIVLIIHGWQFVRSLRSSSAGSSAAGGPSSLSIDSEQDDEQERKAIEQAIEASLTEAAQSSPSSRKDVQAASTSTSSAAASTSTATPTTADVEVEYVDMEPLAVGLSFCIILFSLSLLSMSPHQEPRFLLPLAFPSCVVMAYALRSPFFANRRRLLYTLVSLHAVQHLLQLVLFSFLHQGALLPALFSIDTSVARLPSGGDPLFERYEHHLLYRTFSVPYHLVPRKGRGMFPQVEHYDSRTTPAYVVHMASIACDHTSLYAPTWVVDDLHNAAAQRTSLHSVDLVPSETFGWHVDMDHLAESWKSVRKVGLKRAFAIQKLDVRCTGFVEQSADQQEKEKKEEPALAHRDL